MFPPKMAAHASEATATETNQMILLPLNRVTGSPFDYCGILLEIENPAGWRRAQLCGQQAITLKKLGAAISVAGEELQVSGHKMGFVGGHDLR